MKREKKQQRCAFFGSWCLVCMQHCNLPCTFVHVSNVFRPYATHLQLSDGFKQWFGTIFGCCDTVIGSRYVRFHVIREEFTWTKKNQQQQQHVYVLCRRFFGLAMYSIAFSKSLLQLQFCAFDSVINSHYFCTFNKVSIHMKIINITRLFSSHKKNVAFFGKRAYSFSTVIQE